MPSKEIYNYCLKQGYRVDKNVYTKYDSLETSEDLSQLFEVLSRHNDSSGNHAVMTANTVVANPDFEAIRACQFEQYHYELFTQSLERREGATFAIWQEGVKEKVFRPQFHAREHINIKRWMDDLSVHQEDVHFAFDLDMAGLFSKKSIMPKNKYVVALSYDMVDDWENKADILLDGLNIFEHLFGFQSSSFIPPNYVWDRRYESHLHEAGVRYIQGTSFQLEPMVNKRKRKLFHYTGQRNKNKQIYLVRNCRFEPSFASSKTNVIEDCMKMIDNAFRWKKPAIICSHRLNFIGSIHPYNRSENVKLLNKLLGWIKKKWPEVEFLSSDQLGNIVNSTSQSTRY